MKKRPYTLMYQLWDINRTKYKKFLTVSDALAFIKTLSPDDDWAILNEQNEIVANKGDED
jgi:hypothetical protein